VKRILTISVVLIAVLTLATAFSFAGPDCGEAHATKTTASKSCSTADKAVCSEKFGISPEECEKICKELGDNFQLTKISVKGMTCGGCENDITTALSGVDGVKKVIKVSHKDAMALVAVEKGNDISMALTKAITNKGYKAEITPIVAKTATTETMSKTCTAKERASCAISCPSKSKTTKSKKACSGH